MASVGQIDLISVPDDRYLVRLLAEALEYQGLAVTHRAPGEPARAGIGLGVMTSNGPDAQAWQSLLVGYPQASIITFAHSEQARRVGAYVIAGWPARSSDEAVRSLAKQLKLGTLPAGLAASQSRWGGLRRSQRTQGAEPSPLRVLLVLAGLVALTVWLLRGVDTDQESASTSTEPLAHSAGSAPPPVDAGGPAAFAQTDETLVSAARQLNSGAAVIESEQQSDGAQPPATPQANPLSSSIQRFCQAKTPAAARAWLAVFSWYDNQQAARATCVAEKLQSAEFAELRPELSLGVDAAAP